MSYQPRYSLHPSSRQSSISGSLNNNNPTHQSSGLESRISEKRTELENLQALRELSANLASQMDQLDQKFTTLADGTQAVAAVLSNWSTVLGAIGMASSRVPTKPKAQKKEDEDPFVDSGKREEEEDEEDKEENAGFPRNEEGLPMPQTLVRIPVNGGADEAEHQPQQG